MIKIDKIRYLEENYGRNILPLSLLENERLIGTDPNEVLLFYKKGPSIEKLEESFFKAIEHYNLFSSRLIMVGDNQFALQYCTDGVVTRILPPINATFDHMDVDDIKKRMIHVKTLPGEPLFAVTGIPIEDGILGGISCSHAVGDGISLITFLFAWGCIIEGNPFPLPSAQRLFTGKPVSSDKIDQAFMPPLSVLNKAIQDRVHHSNDHLKLYTRREYFTDAFLREMKNKAKSKNAEYVLSNNQIITAFLAKKYHEHLLPDADKVRLRNAINLREVHPDIDALYIGNAEFVSMTEYTKDEINQMSVYQIAHRLKESIAGMRNETFARQLTYLSRYGVEFKDDAFKKYYPPYHQDTDINSSNLTHFNDLQALGLGSSVGGILDMGLPFPASFMMLKEDRDRILVEITSRYPFT